MDCEKCEPLLLDELYDELDEVTSAAVKRHVAGCASCASALDGMRATRRLVALPLVPAPAGLEDRILAAAREAQKVVPIQSRLSRAVSRAGSWAMRPQTAMAAVFLLMIGTSAFLIRSKQSAPEAAVSVTVAGAPDPESAADHDSLDSKAAANAHGATPARPRRLAPPAAAPAPSLEGALAQAEPAGPMDSLTRGAARDQDDERSLGSAFAADQGPPRARSAAEKKKASAPRRASRSYAPQNAGVAGGAPLAAQVTAPSPPPAAAKSEGSPRPADSFSAGMAAYRARKFNEAVPLFDAAARTGDMNAALWAARSTRDASGCGAALARFEAVASRARGTWTGDEADLDAARCEIQLGRLDAARAKLDRLASTSHAAQAKQERANLDRVAAEKSAGAGGGRPAAAAPARAPAKPKVSKPAADAF